MASALPAFVPASDLGPSPSREAELENLCSRQAEQIERLQDLATEPRTATKPQSGATMRPEEKQALVQLLNDLAEKNKALEKQVERQARSIEDLTKANKDLQSEIYDVRELARHCLKEFSTRLSSLEEKPQTENGPIVKLHLDNLYGHMKAIGRKQVLFTEAAKILGISRQRVHQFKAEIALDNRFVVLKSENHARRKLIRLREYYQKT